MSQDFKGVFGCEKKVRREISERENEKREINEKYSRFDGLFGVRE